MTDWKNVLLLPNFWGFLHHRAETFNTVLALNHQKKISKLGSKSATREWIHFSNSLEQINELQLIRSVLTIKKSKVSISSTQNILISIAEKL